MTDITVEVGQQYVYDPRTKSAYGSDGYADGKPHKHERFARRIEVTDLVGEGLVRVRTLDPDSGEQSPLGTPLVVPVHHLRMTWDEALSVAQGASVKV